MRKLVLVALFMGTPVIAQDVTELKATEVVSGMYMIEGVDGFAGGNITMLVGDEVFIIDDGVPPSGPLLIEMADKLAGHSVDYVVNTHVHGDHVGGNAAMAEDGGLIVAHDNIRRRLLEDTSLSGGPGGCRSLRFRMPSLSTLMALRHMCFTCRPHTPMVMQSFIFAMLM